MKFAANQRRSRTVLIVAATLLASSAAIALIGSGDSDYWKDPVDQWAVITFSHQQHVEEIGAECSDCHAGADTSALAADLLLPTMATCETCHDVEDEETCATCHADMERLEPYAKPVRELVFSHKQHKDSGADCAVCHAGVESATSPSTAFFPSMVSCQSCHDGLQQDNSCESCHSMLKGLLPATHKRPDWLGRHKLFLRTGASENDCASCHTENDCQTCHAEISLQATTGTTPGIVSENRPLLSGNQLLTTQTVHNLNYRFMHAIDARARQSDCASCHDQKQFCATCHDQNQEAGFGSPRPADHAAQGFIRLGTGSGGGLHGSLARKDIETCAACHDIAGADANCVTCHVDRTPGLGNDPKTHVSKFLFKQNGDWHNNAGSTCYTCHMNTGKSGIGFCGYCHGVK